MMKLSFRYTDFAFSGIYFKMHWQFENYNAVKK